MSVELLAQPVQDTMRLGHMLGCVAFLINVGRLVGHRSPVSYSNIILNGTSEVPQNADGLRTCSGHTELRIRVVLGAAALGPMPGAGAIRIADLRHFPDPPEARRTFDPKDVVVLDEAAEVNKFLAGVDSGDVVLVEAHARKNPLDLAFHHAVLRVITCGTLIAGHQCLSSAGSGESVSSARAQELEM